MHKTKKKLHPKNAIKEVNGNKMGCDSKNRIIETRREKIVEFGCVLLQLIACIAAWVIVIVYIIIPIAPIVAVFIFARFIERFFYWYFHGLEAVTGGDSVWMSNGPENRGIITAMLIFAGEIELEKFKVRIFETMIKKPRGSQRHPYRRSTKAVSKGLMNHFWKEEDNFNIDKHVRKWPENVLSKDALGKTVSRLCALPFDLGTSQWEFVVIPWIQNGSTKSAVMFRAHHSMADGGSFVNYLTNVLPDHESKPMALKKFSQNDRVLLSLKGALLSPVFVFKMLTGRTDATVLHGKPLSGEKVVTWSEPLDIETVKKIKAATKTTFNDVLVGCMAASIREFFIKQDIDPPQDVKVSIPIDLRRNWNLDAVEFENRFAVLQLALPTGVSDPLEQLFEVQKRMNYLKTSGEPFTVGPTMDMLLTFLPTWIISPFFNFIVQKCTGVLSNVPGPQNCLQIVGEKLESMTFWAPPRGNLGMTFSITSYNGKIFIGVQSDKALLDDPDAICKEFQGRIEVLKNRLNLID